MKGLSWPGERGGVLNWVIFSSHELWNTPLSPHSLFAMVAMVLLLQQVPNLVGVLLIGRLWPGPVGKGVIRNVGPGSFPEMQRTQEESMVSRLQHSAQLNNSDGRIHLIFDLMENFPISSTTSNRSYTYLMLGMPGTSIKILSWIFISTRTASVVGGSWLFLFTPVYQLAGTHEGLTKYFFTLPLGELVKLGSSYISTAWRVQNLSCSFWEFPELTSLCFPVLSQSCTTVLYLTQFHEDSEFTSLAGFQNNHVY